MLLRSVEVCCTSDFHSAQKLFVAGHVLVYVCGWSRFSLCSGWHPVQPRCCCSVTLWSIRTDIRPNPVVFGDSQTDIRSDHIVLSVIFRRIFGLKIMLCSAIHCVLFIGLTLYIFSSGRVSVTHWLYSVRTATRFNHVLRTAIRFNHVLFGFHAVAFGQAADLHEEARKRGKANVVTYSAAISACAQEKRWKEALSLLSQMRKDVSQKRKKNVEWWGWSNYGRTGTVGGWVGGWIGRYIFRPVSC